jgi:hypothetical protein
MCCCILTLQSIVFGSVPVVVEALRMAFNKMKKHVGQYNYALVVEALSDCLLNYFNVGECVLARIV